MRICLLLNEYSFHLCFNSDLLEKSFIPLIIFFQSTQAMQLSKKLLALIALHK